MSQLELERQRSDQIKPSVLVFETQVNGHHGPYLNWMSTGLARHGFRVTVVIPGRFMEHPAIMDMVAMAKEEGSNLEIIPEDGGTPSHGENAGLGGLLRREFGYWRHYRRWSRKYTDRIRPDVIYLPALDSCLYAFGLIGSPFGGISWAALAMRPAFHYRSMGVIAPRPAFTSFKKILFFRVLRNKTLRRLLIIDEPLARYLENKGAEGDKALFFREPADFGDLPEAGKSKKYLGLDPDRKMLLLYGALSARKGVTELLKALADPGFPPEIDVLLAGKVTDPDIARLLEESWVQDLRDRRRLKIIDRFIEIAEEPMLFAAADIVWAGYRGHYRPSGILVQAAAAGRRLLSCREGVIGWQTIRHDLGVTCDPSVSADVLRAVNFLVLELDEKAPNMERSDTFRPPTIPEAQDALARALESGR